MSLWAACAKCGYRALVADQPVVADLDRAGALVRDHSMSEHFELISADVEVGGHRG